MSAAQRRTTTEIDAEINNDIPPTIDVDRELAQLDERREALRVAAMGRFEIALERLRIIRATAAMRRTHTDPHVVINPVPTARGRDAA